MAISAITAGLGAIGVTGTAAAVGAVMIQGGIIGGAVNAAMGGDFLEGFAMGALTGGAEWAVSGALGAIAPSLGQLGNAIASSAIVAAGTAALLGQKDWLKQGLLGGVAAGIFYTAVDWAQSKFTKPTGAKPGSLVTDKNGNVFLIDNAGNGVHQQDMFAVADDATKTVTIVDKAGNVVNSTNQAAKPSQIYQGTTTNGEVPPRVGLSTIGEIDGVPGTATYYTNGKSTWTPITDDGGFGSSSLIDSGTIIRSDVTIDPRGLKVPEVDYMTASGYQGNRAMNQSTVGTVSIDGVDGYMTSYTFDDEVVTTWKPGYQQGAYVDVTDTFANQKIVNGAGDVFENGKNTYTNLKNNYVDSSGMVYDAAGNPVAKLASAVDNVKVDWSGTLGDNVIIRTNGDYISPQGKYLRGVKQGEFATDMARSGDFYSSGTMNGKNGQIFKIDNDNFVFKPSDGSDTIGFQKSKVNMDSMGRITELAPSKPVDLTSPVNPIPDSAPTIQPPKVRQQYSVSYDGQNGLLNQFDNGTYTFTNNFGETINVPSNQVVKNAYGGVNGFDLPVAAIDIDGTTLSANGTRLEGFKYSGNYVDASGMVYDDFGNPVSRLKTAKPGVDYSGTLYNGKIYRVDNMTLDIGTGKIAPAPGYTVVQQADIPASLKPTVDTTPTKPITPDVVPPTNVDTTPTKPITPDVVPPTNVDTTPTKPITPDVVQPTTIPDSYQVGSRGQIYDANGNQIGQLKAATTNPDLDFSGTLTKDGIITRADGSAINTQGTLVKPATDITIKPAPDATYTPPIDVAPPASSGAGVKMTADEFSRLQNTQFFKNQGGIDIPTINSFIDQGYTPDQIIRAVENNPNGGWGNYNTGIRSMQPGADVTPTKPVTQDVTPTQPVTPDVTPSTVKPVPDSYRVGSRGEIYDANGTQIGQIKSAATNPNVDYSGNLTKDGIITRSDGSAINTQGTVVRPATPIETSQPTTPITPDKPYVDTSGTAYDQFGNPVGPVDTTTTNVPGQPYVDQNGNFHNSSGDIVDNKLGNYVDSSGMVYDNAGNPAGQLTGTNANSGIDYSGTLQPGGFIKGTDGTLTNVNTGTVAPAATEVVKPDLEGSNYVDSSGNLYDQYGNPTKNLSGNYVDSSGNVYDEFGNPAGTVNIGGTKVPGSDLSGILNNNGTITKLEDGSVINLSGQIVAPPGTIDTNNISTITPDKPIIPDKPIEPDKPIIPDKPVDPYTPGIITPIITAPELTKTETPATKGYTLNWGVPPTINLPGVNPGIYAQAVRPYYQGTEIQPQYYWGKHPYAATEADLANYNRIPEAPVQPFGAQFSAVGGNRRMDVNQFVQDYMNPQYQAGYLGSQPQYAGVQGTTSPIQAAPVAPVQPSALPKQTQMQQAAPVFATPSRISFNTSFGSLPPVSIPTWTKEGGLYYAVPTAAAV